MAKGRGKGSEFEREVSKQLSLWWTHGERSDVFWRTSMSGGRATIRSKKGQQTFGQYGDIQAVDPIGQPLINTLTIEVKRGYSKQSPFDVIDRRRKTNSQWEQFIEQAKKDSDKADTDYWMMIQRRDRKATMVYIPWSLYLGLKYMGNLSRLPEASIYAILKTNSSREVYGTTFEQFCELVQPEWFIERNKRMHAYRRYYTIRRK